MDIWEECNRDGSLPPSVRRISVKNHAKKYKDACFSPLLPKATETDAI